MLLQLMLLLMSEWQLSARGTLPPQASNATAPEAWRV
jgi:hypothetical protein